MQQVYDMIVIGGGPAGYTAGLYASRAGLSVLVIEQALVGGQMTLTDIIDNYPGFEEGIEGFTLGERMQKSAERFGTQTCYAQVTKVDFSEKVKKITTSAGEYFARTVVIATGASPRELGVTGEKQLIGRGVHYCAHCDGRFYKDKVVAVVGGGNSAVADALYLSRLAKKVYIIHRRDSLRATKVYHEPLLNAKNIEILWDSKVVSYITDEKFSGVNLKNLKNDKEQALELDGVFISIGRKPLSELFSQFVEIDEYGYIIADESTNTNVNGVYAVGDVRTKALRQVVTAVSDGAVCAYYAEQYLTNEKF